MRRMDTLIGVLSIALLLCFQVCFAKEAAEHITIPVNVGVVLDAHTEIGKMGMKCISMALSDLYASHGSSYKTRLVLNRRDSKGTVVGAAAAALDLLKNVEVQAILGPMTSMQANFVINLGDVAQVPIISFSATSPSLSYTRSEFFFRATLNDLSQVQAISAFIHAFGWKAAVPIYVHNEFGEGIIPFLNDALEKINTNLPYRSVIHPLASDDEILKELYKLMTMQTRVFIVHMPFSLGSRLFMKAKEIGMMSKGYVWITTDGMTNFLRLENSAIARSMQGVIGIKPHVRVTKRLQAFSYRWRYNSQEEASIQDLNIYGLWAYDATIALAMAVEKIGPRHFSFQKINVSNGSMDLDSLPVSTVGKDLQHALVDTRFTGISGDFHFKNRQLDTSIFEIINVVGKEKKVIGIWTTENGIPRNLTSMSGDPILPSSAASLDILWPGDSKSIPKGWVIPTNEKKLRIGVPVKDGSKFVRVINDLKSNTSKVSGFSIDIFDAVMATLPYYVPYDYVPFENADGKSAGSYDDMIYQVYLGNFDAVVGDITIIANRSNYVDFTLPYTESGVTMIVPVKDKKQNTAWVFLKPLTWDLWLTSVCFFIFFAFVIWILERKSNEEFGQTPPQQLGTSLWFSFSTMVFSQREKVVTGLARFVVIIWCFVVLILTQSYTASLTSMLTVSQLEPTLTSIDQLIQDGVKVGYPKGSFVLALLRHLNFNEANLKMYHNMDDLHNAFLDGRIAAAFDELPYMKPFVAKYCSKYTMVAPTLKAGGFGFVFPKGSPLLPDVSRGILIITEEPEMSKFEKGWFGEQIICPDLTTTTSSNRVDVNSFWGLFLIVGAASMLALVVFSSISLYEHRNLFMGSGKSKRIDPIPTISLSNGSEEIEGSCKDKEDSVINHSQQNSMSRSASVEDNEEM
ncbi:glutamate receptor 2.7-like [Coffea eugenioides]|nr:glutamate receptor 2.7-like [Coffea eugenioides]